MHVFVFYVLALTAVLAMSTACLSATDSGYFVFEQRTDASPAPEDRDSVSNLLVEYEVCGQILFYRTVCGVRELILLQC